jgi:hypothetical protein
LFLLEKRELILPPVIGSPFLSFCSSGIGYSILWFSSNHQYRAKGLREKFFGRGASLGVLGVSPPNKTVPEMKNIPRIKLIGFFIKLIVSHLT